MAMSMNFKKSKLPPEVNRILYVKGLPFKITSEEIYDLFGKYGALRQVRLGNGPDTRGSAYIVYEDIFDAKTACEHLNGFNIQGRYLVVLYHQASKQSKKEDLQRKEEEIAQLKR
ncbi:RNA-binding domain-containing protein [Conidiobolus coronatus NRRL 28638]|uniref:RNA-binding domain-containing protein n=1 Tax=Conidiobolus coronatus (strain ATCC 28846 / CBS 209.66 / NRRL 28638) TaxID=796925 RepID=A0A137P4H3_CONC2|nr:RNA-binding domain-containing protein [Conidiobolus coronatus NRRL 28638]|eukprot:KXN69903.1 RNA-binding domain-containing protein [Conidiobolus coronatus NRRL 28638]